MRDDKGACPPYRDHVGDFRDFWATHRRWAWWLIVAALLMKIAVPAGFMPVFADGSVVLELCSGFGPEGMSTAGPMAAMPGMPDHGKHDPADKDSSPCGFSGHAPASMAGADPILLAVAIALIVETLFRMPVAWPVRRVDRLTPPLRGPPAIA